MTSLYSSLLRRSCYGGSRLTFHVSSRFFQLFELLFWWRIALGCAGLISYSYNPPSASWRGSRRFSEIHAPTKDPERDANKDAKNKPLLIRFLRNSLVIYGAFVACLLYDANCFLPEEPPSFCWIQANQIDASLLVNQDPPIQSAHKTSILYMWQKKSKCLCGEKSNNDRTRSLQIWQE